MTSLFHQVVDSINGNPHGWTTPEKGCIMAACIVALRPKFSVEIGVYAGKGLAVMGLAHKAIGFGMAVGIDPYSATASVEGQVKEADQKFWSELNHDAVFELAKEQIRKHSIQNTCKIERCRSDQFDPPDGIGFCRCDGNHGAMVLSDIRRYAPFIVRGGIFMLDDKQWEGGAVAKASQELARMGFKSLYEFDEKENGGLTEVFVKL